MSNHELSRFYAPDIGAQGNFLLALEESRHVTKVLRLGKGDSLELIDGKGSVYTCTILEEGKKGTSLEIESSRTIPLRSNYRMHLAIAPTKNIERFEWMLEKATEIGLDECSPVICQRSERRDMNPVRLEKILIAAMKQSHNVWLPVLHPLSPLKKILELPFSGITAIAHCLDTGKNSLQELLHKKGITPATLPAEGRAEVSVALHAVPEFLILIGPEGDFTELEINSALAAGFAPISLGNTRLRTETAGIVACSEISMLLRES